MYSGKEVLLSINSSMAQIKQYLEQSEEEINQLTQEQINLEKSESEQFRKLAGLRINLLASGDIIKRLDASERRAEELLETRKQTRKALKQKISLLAQQKETLEQQRDTQAQQVDDAIDELDKKEAEIQKKLSIDSNYQQHLQQSQNAERIATHAEEKTQLATDDKINKGKPYEQDPFFMYLWQRNYATDQYHANRLIRYLDKKIAHLCRYDKARANYNMLIELPVRLAEHAKSKRQHADETFQSLKILEQNAATANGIAQLAENLTNKEQALHKAEQDLDAHDEKALTLEHHEVAFVTGDDQEFQDIIKLLTTSFQYDDLNTLYQDAAQTPMPEDDLIVQQLQRIKNSQQELIVSLAQQRQLLKQQQQRQMGLNSVQRLFKQSHYDAVTSVFSDAGKISLLLKQYLNGIFDSNHLWQQLQTMQKNQTRYSDPYFGSGRSPDRVWRGGRTKGKKEKRTRGGFSFPSNSSDLLIDIAGGILGELSKGGGRKKGRSKRRGGGGGGGWGGGSFKTGGGF